MGCVNVRSTNQGIVFVKFFIKERWNPQFGRYYSPMGQMTQKDADKWKKPVYGSNIMHEYDTEEEYNKQINVLRREGANFGLYMGRGNQ